MEVGVERMTDRGKLIELISGSGILCEICGENSLQYCAEALADRFLANGVTFVTGTNDGDKWIPVTERLPEPYVRVLVLRQRLNDGGCFQNVEYIIPVYGGEFAWVMDMARWKSKVTNWMPLPEPPKEE